MKKFLTAFLVAIFIIPCAFILYGCNFNFSFGSSINQTRWKKTFNCSSFYCITSDKDYFITQNTYRTSEEDRNIEYVRLTGGEQPSYIRYANYTSNYNEQAITSISANEFKYGREYFAPILDFVKENFNQFEYKSNLDVYKAQLEVPEDVKLTIKNLSQTENDSYVFVAGIRVLEGNKKAIYNLCIYDKDFENIDESDDEIISFSEFNCIPSIYFMQKSIHDINNFNVDFKVIGGTGLNYMEIYFTKNGMRFYTPNQNDPEGYVDGIYYNDNGTYKYYKKDMNNNWSVSTITKNKFDDVISQIYQMFGGGKLLEEIDNNAHYNDGKVTSFNLEVEGGASGLQKVYYTDYSFDFNDAFTGGKWKIKMYQSFGDITTQCGDFVMTICNLTIDLPTIG